MTGIMTAAIRFRHFRFET